MFFHKFRMIIIDEQNLIFIIYRNVFKKAHTKKVPRKEFPKLVEELPRIFLSYIYNDIRNVLNFKKNNKSI